MTGRRLPLEELEELDEELEELDEELEDELDELEEELDELEVELVELVELEDELDGPVVPPPPPPLLPQAVTISTKKHRMNLIIAKLRNYKSRKNSINFFVGIHGKQIKRRNNLFAQPN